MKLLAFVVILFAPLQAGEKAALALYQPTSDGTTVWRERLFSCDLDTQGRCEIAGEIEPWPDGLLRGEIRLSAGVRPVIWRGGRLELSLDSRPAPLAGETRYDTLDAGLRAPLKQSPQRKGSVFPELFMAGLACLALYGSFRVLRAHAEVSRFFAETEGGCPWEKKGREKRA